jgi:cytochrome P450
MTDATVPEKLEKFPLGAGLRLADLERYDNAALLRRLREEEPLTWFAEQGAWLVTSKQLFDEVMMDPARFVVDVPGNPQAVVLGRMMLAVDEPHHSRHRAPFAMPFRYGQVTARFGELIAERVDALLRRFDGDGSCELASAFANPFAVSAASDVLGLGLEHLDEVHDIYGAFAEGMVGYQDRAAVARAREASNRLDDFLMPAIERLRARGDQSMLAAVLKSGEGSFRDDEELLANLRVILFGAIETVESMILNTTWALCKHPEERRRLASDPQLWPAAVQEGLRWIPPVGYTDRWASADTTLGGAKIARGDYLVPVIASANRDPAAFPDPDRFDVTRGDNRQNLSFGKGIHMCLGVNLARLQGTVALKALFERLPGLRLDPSEQTEPLGFNFRRPPRLALLWDVDRVA